MPRARSGRPAARLRPRWPHTTDLRHRKRHRPRCGRRREAPRRRSLSHRSRTGRAARRGDGVGGLDRDRRGALHCTTRSAAAWAGGARHRKRSLRKSAKNAHCPGWHGDTKPEGKAVTTLDCLKGATRPSSSGRPEAGGVAHGGNDGGILPPAELEVHDVYTRAPVAAPRRPASGTTGPCPPTSCRARSRSRCGP